MRVLCINEGEPNPLRKNDKTTGLVKGRIYNVINSGTHYFSIANRTVDWYELAEWRGNYFEQGLFVPISEMTIEQLIGENELQEA